MHRFVLYGSNALSGILWKSWRKWGWCYVSNEHFVRHYQTTLSSVQSGMKSIGLFVFFVIYFRAIAPLEGITHEGYRVVLAKLLDCDASKYNFIDTNKLWVFNLNLKKIGWNIKKPYSQLNSSKVIGSLQDEIA